MLEDARDLCRAANADDPEEQLKERRVLLLKIKNQLIMKDNFAMLRRTQQQQTAEGPKRKLKPLPRPKSLDTLASLKTDINENKDINSRWNKLREKIHDSVDVRILLGI